nr:MAG TPA: hypothetical protein [Caudoviricetes sp.]
MYYNILEQSCQEEIYPQAVITVYHIIYCLSSLSKIIFWQDL